MNSMSKVFAAFLAVALLYVFPTMQAAERQDDLSQMMVYNAVVQFTDSVRTKGYVTPTMYNDFTQEMNATGNQYNIQLEHLHKTYHPEYSDPANPNTFQNKFTTVYEGYYENAILPVLYTENTTTKDDPSRQYRLQNGDYFTVKVESTNRTMAAILRGMLGIEGNQNRSAVLARYGGMVLNEDY